MAISTHKIFIDTSLFIAFIDRVNLNHQKSVTIFEYMARQNYQAYTSNLVVFQTFNIIERDLGSIISFEFLKAILESNIKILYVTEPDMLFAFRFFKSSKLPQPYLMEVITARLMEKQGIELIITYDYWHNIAGTVVSNLLSEIPI